jgi:hypothetical protein
MDSIGDVPKNEAEHEAYADLGDIWPSRKILRDSCNDLRLPGKDDTGYRTHRRRRDDETRVQTSGSHVETEHKTASDQSNNNDQKTSVAAPPIEGSKVHVPISVDAARNPEKQSGKNKDEMVGDMLVNLIKKRLACNWCHGDGEKDDVTEKKNSEADINEVEQFERRDHRDRERWIRLIQCKMLSYEVSVLLLSADQTVGCKCCSMNVVELQHQLGVADHVGLAQPLYLIHCRARRVHILDDTYTEKAERNYEYGDRHDPAGTRPKCINQQLGLKGTGEYGNGERKDEKHEETERRFIADPVKGGRPHA